MAMYSRARYCLEIVPVSRHVTRCLFKVRTNKEKEQRESKVSGRQDRLDTENLTSTNYNMNMLKNTKSLTTKRTYIPPANIRDIIKNVASTYVGERDWENALLSDPILKFNVLSAIISATQHDVPNSELTEMKSMSDVINFFDIEVKQTSSYEEMASGKLVSLPKNLHIQLEALRFDPKTDTMFGGRTAFPGSLNVVSSIKYRRKYESIKTTKDKPGFNNHYYDF